MNIQQTAIRKFQDHLGLLALHIDGDGKVLAWHGDAQRLGLPSLQHGDVLPDALMSCWQAADLAEGESRLTFVEIDDGQVVHIHMELIDGQPVLYLFDANREYDFQQRLQQKANEVSLLMDEQTRTLEALKEAQRELELRRQEAQRASDAKSHFIASMSHEFRTPISSILGYAELLSETASEDEYSRAIRRAAWHLLILVENLLDQARFDKREIQLNPDTVELDVLFDDLLELFGLQAKNRGIEFHVTKPSIRRVRVDGLRLRQIMINLLSNALRYTSRGSVSLIGDYQDDCLTLRVKDTGPGISEEHRQRIFLPFQRLDSKTTGAGLGLAITQQLVSAMEGDIQLDSRVGEGSEFTVSIPCPLEEPAETAALALTGRVLVVDDDQDILELMKIILEDWGLTVLTAGSVPDAMRQVKAASPQVVISDYHLPQGTAGDLLRELDAGNLDIPVILVSGSFTSSSLRKTFSDRVAGFLTKPISVEFLHHIVSELLTGEKSD